MNISKAKDINVYMIACMKPKMQANKTSMYRNMRKTTLHETSDYSANNMRGKLTKLRVRLRKTRCFLLYSVCSPATRVVYFAVVAGDAVVASVERCWKPPLPWYSIGHPS